MKKTTLSIFIILISIFFYPALSYSQLNQELPKQDINFPSVKPPQTIEEAELVGKDFLNFLPGEIEKGWHQALNIWTIMYVKTVSFFNSYVKNFIKSIWDNIWGKSKEKASEQKDILQKELTKEKEEVQETIKEKNKEISKSLWQIILEKIGISR